MDNNARLALLSRNPDDICAFCNKPNANPLLWGDLLKLNNVVAHYYCVLMSTDLVQNGKDEEGIFGFLVEDINRILEESTHIRCIYCKSAHATSRCAAVNCTAVFHYTCGQVNRARAEFCDRYNSYCENHNTAQVDHRLRLNALGDAVNCIYCFDCIEDDDVYVTECCGSAAMHLSCLRTHAWTVGYDTRCPNCNNEEIFVASARRNGVFIPEEDTLFYLERDMGHILVLKCSADECKCTHPLGRQHAAARGNCRMCVCRGCGGNASHYKCKGTKGLAYLCPICRPVMEPPTPPPPPPPPQQPRAEDVAGPSGLQNQYTQTSAMDLDDSGLQNQHTQTSAMDLDDDSVEPNTSTATVRTPPQLRRYTTVERITFVTTPSELTVSVVLQRLNTNQLREMGIRIPHSYNLRPRNTRPNYNV